MSKIDTTPNRVGIGLRSPLTHLPAHSKYSASGRSAYLDDDDDTPEPTKPEPSPVQPVPYNESVTITQTVEVPLETEPVKLVLSTLNGKQALALCHLLNCSNVEEAARRAGCSARSIHRWMEHPDFRSEYLKPRRASVEQATGNIQSMAVLASETLRRTLTCGMPFAELRAANSVMGASYKALDMMEIENRLRRIDKALVARARPKKGIRR